jgi:hypothetical protein
MTRQREREDEENARLIRQEREARDNGGPLQLTQIRSADAAIRAALKHRILRYGLAISLAGGGVTAADRTGVLDTYISRVAHRGETPPGEFTDRALAASPVFTGLRGQVTENRAAMDKWRQDTTRKLNWLIRQEIRRQVREGHGVSDPPEDEQ